MKTSAYAPPDEGLARTVRLLRGSRVLMFGGIPRENVRQKLERTFELKSLDWMPSSPSKHKATYTIAHSIRAGGLDFVIGLLGLCSHEVMRIATYCKGTRCTFVMVPHGFGVSAIVRAVTSMNLEDRQGDRNGM